ncbi:hypothetical protein U9M48_012189, partial [Paspalum notatum var. saurae]
MAQSPSMPLLAIPPATGAEHSQAEAELWCHSFGYLKSMALRCAIKLGIPNAIHRRGGAATLSELHATVPVAASKRPCLSRIMSFLAVSGLFREEVIVPADAADGGETTAAPRYHLTAASRLLVDDDDDTKGGHRACVSPLLILCTSPFHFTASQHMAEWLQEEDGAAAVSAERTPFMMAHGAGFYDVVRRDAAFAVCFDEAMGSDSRFVAEIVVRDFGAVFAGLTSLVDVGGNNGTTARAIAEAFPHVKCSVLELPHVVDTMPADGKVEFVAGDMMEFIPPADAVLLKFVLHNWSDEDCIQILKRSREAISTREPKGKVVIIDIVLGSQSKKALEAQLLMDLCMMLVLEGIQRTEETWHKIFLDAGFTQYKITPILGTTRSLIE